MLLTFHNRTLSIFAPPKKSFREKLFNPLFNISNKSWSCCFLPEFPIDFSLVKSFLSIWGIFLLLHESKIIETFSIVARVVFNNRARILQNHNVLKMFSSVLYQLQCGFGSMRPGLFPRISPEIEFFKNIKSRLFNSMFFQPPTCKF